MTVDRNALKKVLVLLTIGLIIFIGVFLVKVCSFSKYDRCEAIITKVDNHYYVAKNNNNSDYTYINVIEYKNNYKGKDYTHVQRVFTTVNKHVGDTITVKVNSSNPNEVADTFFVNCGVLIIVIITILDALFLFIYKKS